MKATGVVRRIDELGRIVIPKEIRKNFRIKEGGSVEIFINDDGSIVLKKQSTLNNLEDMAKIMAESIYQTNNKQVLITDTSNIISVSGNKKEYLNEEISQEIIKKLESRNKIIEKRPQELKITEEQLKVSYIINPIVVNGDLLGSIIIFDENIIDNVDISLSDLAIKILVKYVEE